MSDSQLTDLTVKQQRFVQGYLSGKTITAAATEAGYSPSTAARGATELLRSPKVRTAIQTALEAAGITDERLAATISDGLEATKTAHIVHGGQMQTLESPDWAARHRFVDTSLRLKNSYPAEEVNVTHESPEDILFRIHQRRQAKIQAEQVGREGLEVVKDKA